MKVKWKQSIIGGCVVRIETVKGHNYNIKAGNLEKKNLKTISRMRNNVNHGNDHPTLKFK